MPVDWWALGVVIYEITTGFLPFTGTNETQTFTNILQRNIDLPAEMCEPLQRIILELLTVDTTQRLACDHRGASSIRQHAWFDGYDWEALRQQVMTSPLPVQLSNEGDVRYFKDAGVPAETITAPYDGDQALFRDWC